MGCIKCIKEMYQGEPMGCDAFKVCINEAGPASVPPGCIHLWQHRTEKAQMACAAQPFAPRTRMGSESHWEAAGLGGPSALDTRLGRRPYGPSAKGARQRRRAFIDADSRPTASGVGAAAPRESGRRPYWRARTHARRARLAAPAAAMRRSAGSTRPTEGPVVWPAATLLLVESSDPGARI